MYEKYLPDSLKVSAQSHQWNSTEKAPPCFQIPKNKGGAFLVLAQNPKKFRAFGAVLYTFSLVFRGI